MHRQKHLTRLFFRRKGGLSGVWLMAKAVTLVFAVFFQMHWEALAFHCMVFFISSICTNTVNIFVWEFLFHLSLYIKGQVLAITSCQFTLQENEIKPYKCTKNLCIFFKSLMGLWKDLVVCKMIQLMWMVKWYGIMWFDRNKYILSYRG